jgi:hypothetical protein
MFMCPCFACINISRISLVAMTGAAITIDDVSATDSVLSVKRRVFAANRQLPVRRQRIVYRPGPRGMEALADDETLGGAGVAQDGSAELDVLLADLTPVEVAALGLKVRALMIRWMMRHRRTFISREISVCCVRFCL